jgi:hypothetical protein
MVICVRKINIVNAFNKNSNHFNLGSIPSSNGSSVITIEPRVKEKFPTVFMLLLYIPPPQTNNNNNDDDNNKVT